MSPTLVLMLVTCVVAFAWKAYQLLRAPWDRALWIVLLAIAWLLVSVALLLDPVRDAIGGVGSVILSAQSGQVFTYLLLCFFSFADRTRQARGARGALLQLLPLAVTAMTMVALLLSLPPELQNETYARADVGVPQVVAFYVIGNVYLMYGVGYAAVLAFGIARRSDRRTRTGLTLAVAGLVLCSLSGGVRAVDVVLRADGIDSAAIDLVWTYALSVGVALFAVGATYPGLVTRVAAIRRWNYQRKLVPALDPLWSALTGAFPDGNLHSYPNSVERGGRLRAVRRRCSRRTVECRDGLVRISPHLAELGVADAENDPDTIASALWTALAQRAEGRHVGGAAVRVLQPSTSDLDDDVACLVALSLAMRRVKPLDPLEGVHA